MSEPVELVAPELVHVCGLCQRRLPCANCADLVAWLEQDGQRELGLAAARLCQWPICRDCRDAPVEIDLDLKPQTSQWTELLADEPTAAEPHEQPSEGGQEPDHLNSGALSGSQRLWGTDGWVNLRVVAAVERICVQREI